jgi:hypothetical protein
MLSLAVFAGFLALLWANAPAQAAPVTWVSGTGNDADNCTTPATPCRTLSGAFAKTDELGVMNVLPGEYSTLTIDKSIQIIADGGQAPVGGASVAGSVNATLVVNAGAGDLVRIRGLVMDRIGSSGGGIGLIAGGALYVENCTILASDDDFGIQFEPTGSSELYVTNTAISDNGIIGTEGGGILIQPSGSGSAKVVLDDVLVENNSGGILISGGATSGASTVTISNSKVAGNASFGVFAIDSGGGATNVTIEDSTSAEHLA